MSSATLAGSRAFSGADLRRSTRIEKTVPLLITGHDAGGQGFLERTTAVSVSLHGCRYSSRHQLPVGTWIVLRIGESAFGEITTTVRAQVRSVHPPSTLRDSVQLGVELESPGNIWRVSAPPEDWIIANGNASALQTAGATGPGRAPQMSDMPQARDGNDRVAAEPAAPSTVREAIGEGTEATGETALASREEQINKIAETAVLSAIRRHLGPAVRSAIRAMEESRESGVQQVVDASVRQRSALVHSSREELLARLEDRAEEVRSRWEAQLDGFRMRAEEILNRVDRQAGTSRRELAEVKNFTETALRETGPKIAEQLDVAMARATEEFERGAAQAADRHLVRLLEEAQSITREATAYLEANVSEARATVLTAANSAMEEFRRQAELHATVTAADTTQRITSALAALDAESRTACEERRKAIEADVTRTGEQLTEGFRSSLKAFFYSCLVAAVGAVEQHSQVTKSGLSLDDKSLPPQP